MLVVRREDEDEIGRNEDYHRIATLAASLKREELLTLGVDAILHRLFWQEDVLRFAPQPDDPSRILSAAAAARRWVR